MSEVPERLAKLEVAVDNLTEVIKELKADVKENNGKFVTKFQIGCWLAGICTGFTGLIAKGWLKI